MTKEQFLKTKTHKVVRISQSQILYAEYNGTADECMNIINARLQGVWAVICLTDEEKNKLWNIYNNDYNYEESYISKNR